MTPDMNEEINKIKLHVGLLEKDIKLINKFCDKISETIERIQELNVNFIKIISICEQRHNAHDSKEDTLLDNVKELSTRLTTLNNDVQSHVARIERCVTSNINSIKEEIADSQQNKNANSDHNAITRTIDKYRYMVIGGAMVIGWLFAHIDGIFKVFSIFK